MGCLVMHLSGCTANWKPAEIPQPKPLNTRAVLEFHILAGTKDSVVRLHAVQFTKDSVSGVSWLQRPTCDTCRIAFPLNRITNPRLGNPERAAWSFAVVAAVLGGAALLLYWAFSQIPAT